MNRVKYSWWAGRVDALFRGYFGSGREAPKDQLRVAFASGESVSDFVERYSTEMGWQRIR